MELSALPEFVRGPVIGGGLKSVSGTVPRDSEPAPAHGKGVMDRANGHEQEGASEEVFVDRKIEVTPSSGSGRPKRKTT